MDPKGRAALRKELLAFVGQRIPPPGRYREFDACSLRESLSQLGVERVLIFNSRPAVLCWTFASSRVLPQSCPDWFQGEMNRKAARLAEYKKKAEMVWLLILSGTGGLPSMVYFDGDVLTHRYSSDFDRLFVFGSSYGFGELHKL